MVERQSSTSESNHDSDHVVWIEAFSDNAITDVPVLASSVTVVDSDCRMVNGHQQLHNDGGPRLGYLPGGPAASYRMISNS